MPKANQDQDFNSADEVKKNHTKISASKKNKLIELVMKNQLTIYKAAKRLKLCHPTAKFIIKHHKLAMARLQAQPKETIKVQENPQVDVHEERNQIQIKGQEKSETVNQEQFNLQYQSQAFHSQNYWHWMMQNYYSPPYRFSS